MKAWGRSLATKGAFQSEDARKERIGPDRREDPWHDF